MAKITGWKPKVGEDGKVRLIKPARRMSVSQRLRQKNSKRQKAVSPGRAALLGMIR